MANYDEATCDYEDLSESTKTFLSTVLVIAMDIEDRLAGLGELEEATEVHYRLNDGENTQTVYVNLEHRKVHLNFDVPKGGWCDWYPRSSGGYQRHAYVQVGDWTFVTYDHKERE